MEPHETKVIAITSGKGGVGKTNIVANTAITLSKMGKRVLVMDADLGLGNIDILLGLTPKYNIGHFLRGEKGLEDIIIKGPEDTMILPASSGIQELTELDAEEQLSLVAHLDEMVDGIDMMIIDTGAGISSNVIFFNMAAQDIVVIASPEPTSITDAYALMKVLSKRYGEKSFRLLVNGVDTEEDGRNVYRKLSTVGGRFLNISVDYLGYILYDELVQLSVVQQKAVVQAYPDTPASICFDRIAKRLCEMPVRGELKGGMQFFWRKMLNRTF